MQHTDRHAAFHCANSIDRSVFQMLIRPPTQPETTETEPTDKTKIRHNTPRLTAKHRGFGCLWEADMHQLSNSAFTVVSHVPNITYEWCGSLISGTHENKTRNQLSVESDLRAEPCLPTLTAGSHVPLKSPKPCFGLSVCPCSTEIKAHFKLDNNERNRY